MRNFEMGIKKMQTIGFQIKSILDKISVAKLYT